MYVLRKKKISYSLHKYNTQNTYIYSGLNKVILKFGNVKENLSPTFRITGHNAVRPLIRTCGPGKTGTIYRARTASLVRSLKVMLIKGEPALTLFTVYSKYDQKIRELRYTF